MAFSDFHQYLIAYDIADPRRLGRLYRHIKKTAIPLQYSVFTAWLNHGQLVTLLAEIEELINPVEDDVRIYPLTKNAMIEILGSGFISEGVHLLAKEREITLQPGGLPSTARSSGYYLSN